MRGALATSFGVGAAMGLVLQTLAIAEAGWLGAAPGGGTAASQDGGALGAYAERAARALGIVQAFPQSQGLVEDFKRLPLALQVFELVLLFSPVLLVLLLASPGPAPAKAKAKANDAAAPPPAPASKAPALDGKRVGDAPTSREAARMIANVAPEPAAPKPEDKPKPTAAPAADKAAAKEKASAAGAAGEYSDSRSPSALRRSPSAASAGKERAAPAPKASPPKPPKTEPPAKTVGFKEGEPAKVLTKAEERKAKRKAARKQFVKTLRKVFCMR